MSQVWPKIQKQKQTKKMEVVLVMTGASGLSKETVGGLSGRKTPCGVPKTHQAASACVNDIVRGEAGVGEGRSSCLPCQTHTHSLIHSLSEENSHS